MAERSSDEKERQKVHELWKNAHALSGDQVLKELNVNPDKGLTTAEAERRLRVHGNNELPRKPPRPIWMAILEQFSDVLVLILLGAAIFSFFIAVFGGEAEEEGIKAFIEPLVILLILVANATIGVWQEMNAEKALEALMVLQTSFATVIRDGETKKIMVPEVVPGDICLLEGGDKVPADIRALRAMALQVSQAILTGESEPINKLPEEIITIKGATNQDKVNILFSATEIAMGQATGVVVGTGMNSELGNIQSLIQSASENKRKTPLKENLEHFGTMLSYIVGIICIISWLINIPKFSDPGHGTWMQAALYYFKISVSLAVAAVPEGLPAVITTCLALATKRMANIRAIIRHLSSVETLGCTTVICSDKTGTLTVNKMTVIEFSFFNSPDKLTTLDVSTDLDGEVKDMTAARYEKATLMAQCAMVAGLCNDARIKIDPDKSEPVSVGSATEAALRYFIRKLAKYDNSMKAAKSDRYEWYAEALDKKVPQLAKFPFTRDRKAMSVIVEGSDKKKMLFIKGAAEVVLEKYCSSIKLEDNRTVKIDSKIRAAFDKAIEQSTSKGLRCIAMAVRENVPRVDTMGAAELNEIAADSKHYSQFENNCTFIGYVGIQDPPRKEVQPAIEKCKEAGISVIMITGDNKDTASAIAKKIELLEKDENARALSLEGREFDALETKEAKIGKLKDGVKVFSRVEPRHKIELVTLLQEDLHHVVAMTGDGVNDAPALKKADIGIAMGITGSDVAKEASKMVLADDNFATIVNAIEEGRAIYTNIKSFIRYLISSNIGEVVAVFAGSLLGIPEVLTSVQLLWMNLVTDGLPALALGFNPPEVGIMKLKPRRKDEPIIGGWSLLRYMIIGTYVGLATVAIYVHWYTHMDIKDNHKLVSFYVLRNWSKCSGWDAELQKQATIHKTCDLFHEEGNRATTMSLSLLVVLEMVGALNALSESQSLLVTPPWKNMWLCGAIALSTFLHLLVINVPFLQMVFGVVTLNKTEWMWIMIYALPALIFEEIIKLINRMQLEKSRVHKEKHD